MRTILFFITLVLLLSCIDKKVRDKTAFYYIIDSDRSRPHDTIKRSDVSPDKADTLLAKDGFTYQNKEHGIYLYTSDNHAQIDGGRLYYTLDTFGIIFERSTTWRTSLRLRSNNDSINDIISHALAHILSNPQLHSYQSGRYDQSRQANIVNEK